MTEALTGKIRQKNKNTDMKNECLLVAGGKENKIDLKFFHGFENVFVIACDKGYEYCVKQNVPIDFLCGDFDSCSLEIPEEKTIPFGVDVLPSHKDDTDLIYTFKTNDLHIISKDKVAWTLDGEFGGVHEDLVIKNLNKQITIMC